MGRGRAPDRHQGRRMSRPCIALALAVGWLVAASGDAGAQEFPDRPIKLIVPFPAGGPTDTSARLVAQGMATRLGQPVITENQGGAGGTIGTRQAATARPDGYTLLVVAAANTFGTMPLLYRLDYDPSKAFVPVGATVVDRQLMVVTPSVPVRTARELVDYAKANPGKLSYGAATGIGPHFILELVKRKAGVDILHVPYRGGGPMIADLIGGQIQLGMSGKSTMLPHVEAGKLRAVAVTSAGRWRELPDVPTLLEQRLLDWPYDTYAGVVAPTGTPAGVIRRLNAAINEGLALPEIRAGFAKLGIEPRPGTPEDFAAVIAEEAGKWPEIVRMTGIKAAE
jgi:tripartite-type tricarboxylate transporter receptor subunit TctC